MDQKLIDRINYLARKKKTIGLTQEELKEQEELRNEYRRQFRANLMNQVSNIRVINSIEENSINEIKATCIDQISLNDNYVCNLDLVTILYTLINKEFVLNKDKLFVLDNTYTCILYTILHLCGYDVSFNDIKCFSKYNYDNEFTILDVLNNITHDSNAYNYLLLDDKLLLTLQLENFDNQLNNFIPLINVDSLHEEKVVEVLKNNGIDYVFINNELDEISRTINDLKNEFKLKFILIRFNNEIISKGMLTNEYIDEEKKKLNVSKNTFNISDITYNDFKNNTISRSSKISSNDNSIDTIRKILDKISE